MFGKKKTKLEKAQEAGVNAIEQVQDAFRNLPVEQWQDKLYEIKDNAGDLAERTRSNVSDHAHAAAERARNVAESQDLAGKKEAIQGTISGASKLVASRLRHDSEAAAETVRDATQEHLPQQDSGLSKWIWLGAGMALGGVIALVLAPASGRRSRAMLRDKLSQGKQQAAELGKTAGETVSSKVVEVKDKVSERVQDAGEHVAEIKDEVVERVQDATGQAKEKSEEVQADMKATIEDNDETIADRVRTALGENEATRDLERINVTSCDGVVTLHGPKLKADQKKKVEEVVQAVAGVKEVQNELDAGKSKSA